ncbi:unnamed protein product [Calicophoron daubneyi]|uniref:Uncharacterized protein n=1 Tax=Calicophoron daubneyi TaxID=300641 RepID=A0AAV2TSY6_CALDB
MIFIQFLFLWLPTVITSLSDQNPRHEFLPKRLNTPKNSMDYLSDSQIYFSHDNETKPLPYLTDASPCPMFCYLRPPNEEMLQCARHERKWSRPIQCRHFSNRGEIMIGDRESIRGIIPGTLKYLLYPGAELPIRTGQLSVYLNLNMVRLDIDVFQGLENAISEVRLLNTVQIDPDSLIALRHLRSFEIDSGRTPVIILNNRSEALADEWKYHNSESSMQTLPTFLRLNPLDRSIPISFNLQTRCHQCSKTNATEESPMVVVFTDARADQAEKTYRHSGFSMLFPQTCPKIEGAVGCPDELNITALQPMAKNMGTFQDNGLLVHDLTGSNIVLATTQTPSLLILLSIWCTVLTVVVVLIICLVYFCTKRISERKKPPKWIPAFCIHQPSSADDVSSNSINSAFCNKQSDLLQPEANTLLNSVMTDSQHSWNSTHKANNLSASNHSLKERGGKTPGGLLGGQMAHRSVVPSRRSVGSQTDFTEMDPDTMLYSSLRRPSMCAREYLFPDPPLRTASQYALSRVRYLGRMEPVYPRFERYTRYSVNGPGFYYPSAFGSRINQDQFRFNNGSNMTDLHILAVDDDTLDHPALTSLPPIHPFPRLGSQSPAPWRKPPHTPPAMDI